MGAKEDTLDELVSEIQVEIKNTNGLHLRPAMQFVDLATQFESEIRVRYDELEVDGKSIMEISTLAATCGVKLLIRAEGPDAEEAVQALQQLVEVELPKTSGSE